MELNTLIRMGVDIKKFGIDDIDDTLTEYDRKYDQSLAPEEEE